MATPPSIRTLTVVLAWGLVMTEAAEAQLREDCTMAGPSVRVEVQAGGTARQSFTYVVINDRRERLHRVRIGSGGSWHTDVVAQQAPQIVTTPESWRGAVMYSADTTQVDLSWEAVSEVSALRPRSRTAFGIEVPWSRLRPGQVGPDGQPFKPIRFDYRPFTVYSESGCWWGWTAPDGLGTPAGGYLANTLGAAVRSFDQAGRHYVIVDAPAFDVQLRVARQQLFLTMPLALSWGVSGGFSHNASIGIGLRWSPVNYVSVYAQTHIGTFFFTNRTHLRHVGIDINIPRYSVSSTGSVRRNKYLVFGVEYFDRSVVRWAGFMDGPQWYASGRGLAIRFGIRGVTWGSG
jgi:hypothetical protein